MHTAAVSDMSDTDHPTWEPMRPRTIRRFKHHDKKRK
jgi:hypothetical protein